MRYVLNAISRKEIYVLMSLLTHLEFYLVRSWYINYNLFGNKMNQLFSENIQDGLTQSEGD